MRHRTFFFVIPDLILDPYAQRPMVERGAYGFPPSRD